MMTDRELRGVPTEELAEHRQFLTEEHRKMIANGYEPQRAEKFLGLDRVSRELERREGGGKIARDTRVPYMTDGERAGFGLPEKADNM